MPFAAAAAPLPAPAAEHCSTGAASYVCAAGPAAQSESAHQTLAQWKGRLSPQPLAAAAASLPAADPVQSWADVRSTSSTPQPMLLPTVASAPVPAAAAWPVQQGGMSPPGSAVLNGSSAVGGSSAAGGAVSWDAVQFAACHTNAVRRADVQLLAAGLAAAGRLGLLPSAAQQLAPAHMQAAAQQQAAAAFQQPAYQRSAAEQAAAYQQALARHQAAYQHAMAAAQQRAAAQQQVAAYQRAAAQQQAAAAYPAAPQQQAPCANAGAAPPELPSDADLLGLMLDNPNE